jgi:MATE family multidrug resistance protein
MFAQALQSANSLVDALVAGRLGRDELAAGGIGAGIWFFSSLICIGLLAGLSPTLSKLIGERRRNAVGAGFRQGVWLGVLCGVAALLLNLCLIVSVPYWRLADGLAPLVRSYLTGACWGLPAFAMVMVCRNVFEATGITRPVLLVQLIGLGVNILGNLGFGLGWFGLPKLGLFGIGISTTLVMLSMALALFLFLRGPRFGRYKLFAQFEPMDSAALKIVLSLSVPIFFALLFEAGLFSATAVQMGILGANESAAHNIAISIAALTYMLPLGMSFAITARIGHVFGRGAVSSVRVRVVTGVVLTVLLAVITAILLLLSRDLITTLFTSDESVRRLASHLLIFAALFQLSDGAQATLIGMLRGLQDTRIPMLINAFSYWGVAFLLGYLAAHHWGMGATGLWLGLVIGLSVSSLLLATRLHNRLKVLDAQ